MAQAGQVAYGHFDAAVGIRGQSAYQGIAVHVVVQQHGGDPGLQHL